MNVGINIKTNKVYVAIVNGGLTSTVELAASDALLLADQLKSSAEVVQRHKTNAVAAHRETER